MHRYEARVRWSRGDAKFTDNRYSRGHEWSFDGGVTVPASSSPGIVPLPNSVAAAVDPEEALVASASSCHMLFFLSLAAKKGFVVDRYDDAAWGILERNAEGKDESIFLEPVETILRNGLTPADEILTRYGGEWGRRTDPLFRDYAF